MDGTRTELTPGPTLNVPLLREVQEHIRRYPQQAEMDGWGYNGSCGTIACIAGWTCLIGLQTELVDGTLSDMIPEIQEVASQLLGITQREAYETFHVSNWPYDLRAAYYRPSANISALMIERIERLIAAHAPVAVQPPSWLNLADPVKELVYV